MSDTEIGGLIGLILGVLALAGLYWMLRHG
jgi:hypothetical protein